MFLFMCKSKIHRIILTAKELHYQGSIGVDRSLLNAAQIWPGERVQVLNLSNGARLETYTIAETEGSGKVILYGPAARLAEVGDTLIVISYCLMTPEEASKHEILVVSADDRNRLKGEDPRRPQEG